MLVLALLTPAQEANASMGSTLILAVVLTIGAVYALVLVVLPVLGGIKATRNWWQLRSITKFIASQPASTSAQSITRPVSPVPGPTARAHITHVTHIHRPTP